MDIFDDEGLKESGLMTDLLYPAIGTAAFTSVNLVRNAVSRLPLGTSIHFTVLAAAVGLAAGIKARDIVAERQALTTAVCKHYIMLHPEKFPEPERKKFGDKEVFLNWFPNR